MPLVRLQRFLAQSGVAARRKAEELIVAGRVKVNGRVEARLGSKVDANHDTVSVDGKPIRPEKLAYLVLNKPKGYVTTMSDPQGRHTVMELVEDDGPKVKPVGRLDYYTEGVLLLSNDGELAARLLSSEHHVEKTYHVKIRGEVREKDVEAWAQGVRLRSGRRTRPALVDVIKYTGRHTWLVVTLQEGVSRQIHEMAAARGYQVIKLARVAFAGITYEGLKVGHSRPLSQREVSHLRHLVGLTD